MTCCTEVSIGREESHETRRAKMSNLQAIKMLKHKNLILVFGVAVLGLVLGYVFGASVAGGHSVLNYFVRNSIPVPGEKPDRSFVLGDFESGEALEAWKVNRAKIEISPDHAKEGNSSARVAFFGHVKVSQVGLKDYFTSQHALFDWSKYESLSFYIFNPQGDERRVILQIADRKGRIYKQDFYLKGNSGETFVIPVTRIANEINVKRINELSFFEWNLGNGFYLHFDDIKLTA